MKRLIEELRPEEWYKQSVILIPILFSRNLTSLEAIISMTIAVISFSFMASTVYIINDISDIEEDRNHPIKKDRPIASGDVSIRQGVLTCIILFLCSCILAYYLGLLFLGVLIVYFGQNLLYSYHLKNIAFVDILMISFGFVLRAVSGAVAISEPVSSWLIACVGFLALMLGVGKRKNEIQKTDDFSTRNSLSVYNELGIDKIMTIVVSSLISVYALYTFTYNNYAMIITIPSVVFALFRYVYLVESADVGSDPSKLLFDRQFMSNMILWTMLAFIVLYKGGYINRIIKLI